jgi:phospholipid/cholesterol/gamma-HCH transport system substrate-binding protein
MTRVLAIGAVLLAAVVLAVVATGADDGDDGAYRVRAIFMNASFLVDSVDVKVAGVKVGTVESLDVTRDNRAAVTLLITDDGFKDFKSDAECAIRPQSLIGDKFVECSLTQPRPAGQPEPGPLRKIEEGEGKGDYLLPVEQTSKPVDPDLVVDTFQLPYRQRLSIILNELGTGLAGQGEALRTAIRNADPALKETDKVIKLLAGQNQVLADLADDSDRVLAPLARNRRSVSGFVENGRKAAEATAERSAALEETIRLLPPFLRELGPTMDRLGGLADEMTPVLRDAGAVAPDVNRFTERLEPFSRSSLSSFRTLGAASVKGREALTKSEPFFETLEDFTISGKPLTKDLRDLLVSLRDTGGIESLLNLFYYLSGSSNGYDGLGHYFRVGLLAKTECLLYATEAAAGCNANFYGKTPADAKEEEEAAAEAPPEGGEARAAAIRAAARSAARAQSASAGPAGSSSEAAAPAAPAAPAPAQAAAGGTSSTDESLLDYLLGD